MAISCDLVTSPGRTLVWASPALIAGALVGLICASAIRAAEPGPATNAVAVAPPSTVAASVTAPAESRAAAVPAVQKSAVRKPKVPISAKILRYAERIVKQYDANGDGKLQGDELKQLASTVRQIDLDRDGVVSAEDLAQYIVRYGWYRNVRLVAPLPRVAAVPTALLQPDLDLDVPDPAAGLETTEIGQESPTSGTKERSVRRVSRFLQRFYVPPGTLPQGLPEWFMARDADGDGQVTLAEFAPKATRSELEEFSRLDTDHDGVITVKDLTRSGRAGR
jgi:hypothetical protein